jgi:hypothetical protein
MSPTLRSMVVVAGAALFMLVPLASTDADPPGTPRCNPGWDFVDIRAKNTGQKVIDAARVENKDRRPTTATFTSSKSGTIGWSSTGKVGGGIDAVIFSVNGDYNETASESLTAQIGVSTTVTVPRRRAVVGTYGVFRRPFIGTLQRGNRFSRCVVQRKVKVKLPVGSGWRTRTDRL